MTGTASGAGLVNVEVYDGTDDLGAAAIDAGTHGWALDLDLTPGVHRLTAVATDLFGHVASVQSPWELNTGISGRPYVDQEFDLDGNGKVVATASYDANGSLVNQSASDGVTSQTGTSAGQVIHSVSNDVMIGEGGSTTFVFTSRFGQDEITNFNYLNAIQSPIQVEHDILSLPQADFHNMAQLFRHITTALDGDAVIHLNPHDSIKLDGVTKADLVKHPNVFRFHA